MSISSICTMKAIASPFKMVFCAFRSSCSSNETEEALSVEASPVLKDSAPAPISEEPQETAAEPKKPKKKKVQNEDLVADAMAARALAKKNKAKKAKNSS